MDKDYLCGFLNLLLIPFWVSNMGKSRSRGGGGSRLNFGQGCAARSFKMAPLARPIFLKMIPLANFYIKSAMSWHLLGKTCQIFAF